MKRASFLFVAASCLGLLTGCFTGFRSGLGQALGIMVEATLTTPLDFVVYSEMYWEKNNRWPADFNELKEFTSTNLPTGTNSPPSFANYRNVDFTVLTNGSLKIRYVLVQTNSISTNQILLPPVEKDSNGVWRISSVQVQIGAVTNAE